MITGRNTIETYNNRFPILFKLYYNRFDFCSIDTDCEIFSTQRFSRRRTGLRRSYKASFQLFQYEYPHSFVRDIYEDGHGRKYGLFMGDKGFDFQLLQADTKIKNRIVINSESGVEKKNKNNVV